MLGMAHNVIWPGTLTKKLLKLEDPFSWKRPMKGSLGPFKFAEFMNILYHKYKTFPFCPVISSGLKCSSRRGSMCRYCIKTLYH